MLENELFKKIQNAEDSTEEEDMVAATNEELKEKAQEELEMHMEEKFYMFDEKKQRVSLREGLKFNIRRTINLDEYIEYERTSSSEEKEAIKEHIRELLLKKKSPSKKRDLFKTD